VQTTSYKMICFASLLAGLSVPTLSLADNCTGYDALVTTSAETRDLGNGMKLTVFQAESMLFSEDSKYNLVSGQCVGTTLETPDGKARSSGHCARHDKDGDTASIEWSNAPGAEKGVWKSTGGTGKFSGVKDSGWSQAVRSDGKMFAVKWGGNCQ
jgi:hypothetical protein